MMEMTIFEGITITAAFLMGLSSGAHCLMMCGGFVAALSGGEKPDAAPVSVVARVPAGKIARGKHLFLTLPAAQLGRLTTYLLMGALFGALGSVIAVYVLPTQRILATLAAVMLLWIAFSIARGNVSLLWAERIGLKLYSAVFRRFGANIGENTVFSRYFLGLLWGITPCGMVYTMLAFAITSGSAAGGALLMLAFGLGTLPNLFVAGAVFSVVKKFLQFVVVRSAIAVVIAGFALYSLNGLWMTNKMDRLMMKATNPPANVSDPHAMHQDAHGDMKHDDHAMPSGADNATNTTPMPPPAQSAPHHNMPHASETPSP